MAALIINEVHQLFFEFIIEAFQDINRVIGVHVLQNICRELQIQLLKIRLRILQISQNV